MSAASLLGSRAALSGASVATSTANARRHSFSAAARFTTRAAISQPPSGGEAEANTVYGLCGGEDSWIGLEKSEEGDDKNADSSWTWTDGTEYGVDPIRGSDTERWASGQGSDSSCGRWGWKGSGDWDDVSCGEERPYTCRGGKAPPALAKGAY